MHKAPFKIIPENFHLSFAINSEYVHSIIFLFSEYISKSIYETDTCSGFQKAYEFEYETGTLNMKKQQYIDIPNSYLIYQYGIADLDNQYNALNLPIFYDFKVLTPEQHSLCIKNMRQVEPL